MLMLKFQLLNTIRFWFSYNGSTGRFVGQRKIVVMTTDNGDVTMTQSGGNLNSTNVSTSIVFNDVGDNVFLVYNGSNWNVVSSNGFNNHFIRINYGSVFKLLLMV